MRHLFNSRCEVLRLSGQMVDGTPTLSWTKVGGVVDPVLGTPGELMCRLDLTFQRPGKDQPMPIVAGRAPDRVGVMFFDATDNIVAGDRIHCLAGPLTGTFEIRSIPDPAVAYAAAHHGEVQVIEVSQTLPGIFPGATVEA
jgi:hypothetical protein